MGEVIDIANLRERAQRDVVKALLDWLYKQPLDLDKGENEDIAVLTNALAHVLAAMPCAHCRGLLLADSVGNLVAGVTVRATVCDGADTPTDNKDVN